METLERSFASARHQEQCDIRNDLSINTNFNTDYNVYDALDCIKIFRALFVHELHFLS